MGLSSHGKMSVLVVCTCVCTELFFFEVERYYVYLSIDYSCILSCSWKRDVITIQMKK